MGNVHRCAGIAWPRRGAQVARALYGTLVPSGKDLKSRRSKTGRERESSPMTEFERMPMRSGAPSVRVLVVDARRNSSAQVCLQRLRRCARTM